MVTTRSRIVVKTRQIQGRSGICTRPSRKCNIKGGRSPAHSPVKGWEVRLRANFEQDFQRSGRGLKCLAQADGCILECMVHLMFALPKPLTYHKAMQKNIQRCWLGLSCSVSAEFAGCISVEDARAFPRLLLDLEHYIIIEAFAQDRPSDFRQFSYVNLA